MENIPLQVSDAIALINQTLDYAYPTIVVEGEVSGFKINKDKYVFFDIKDAEGSLNCFMMVFQLGIALEDGMKVRLVAKPNLTKWGKFSLTVRSVQPVGEGSLKRAFELLKAKLDKEGLFAPERKRLLPSMPERVGVISSTGAAGYADFMKILNNRWQGVELLVANTQVQGEAAPTQMVRAIEHFNEMSQPVEALVIIRGGGSQDDLAAFNDERLVRAIAASRTPTLVGVGHEVDVSLADLAADVRAATPSNAAEILVPDRRQLLEALAGSTSRMISSMHQTVRAYRRQTDEQLDRVLSRVDDTYLGAVKDYQNLTAVLRQLDPKLALKRGYALVRDASGRLIGDKPPRSGQVLSVETSKFIIETGVKNAREK
ncbi:MAG TPA: exodeoxyribonuclease VII large subunit [Candidatus Saccharimonadales bacterium]|nr:exodeoxyribonuclease VII large subunit [Candidatus Saccharimonadales bacterium]